MTVQENAIPSQDDGTGEEDLLLGTELGRHGDPPPDFYNPELNLANQSRTRFTRRLGWHLLTCVFMFAHLVASAYYLLSKAKVFTINVREVLTAPWVVLIWFLELCYFCSSLFAAIDNLLPPNNRPDLHFDGLYNPTVDIFLPCCKEPTDVVEDSIRAALKLDYPNDCFKVLVLDDGGDDDLKVLCQTLQVETAGQVVYLRRQKVPGVPHHFKCGNMNYGLKHSKSEYVVMMDADMILHPSFLRRLLPHIVNSPDIAFVQIPQSYYNLPMGDPLSDASVMGYDKVLVHRDSLGCATCIGTGCLFRRKHLNAIGGFQSQSITEDTTTAYSLFNAGYRSVYLNEKLQIGLTPWTFEGYIKQRCRWGQGAMQQFKTTSKDMLGKKSKLNFVLKVLYFWHSGYYFLSFVNIMLIATLTCALMFRFKIVVGTRDDNRELIVRVATSLILWRCYWYCLWYQVPKSVQSRNRDESHFWWMTPFFITMIIESLFSYSSTFKFIPTSNIDRNVSSQDQSPWMKQRSKLKLVRFHLGYTIVVISVVIARGYMTVRYYGLDDCKESFYITGLSFFLLTTVAHMMLPVMYVLWPTNFQPSQRKSLLKYDACGTPIFNPRDYWEPKSCRSVLLYEAMSWATITFWLLVVVIIKSGADQRWCRNGLGVFD